MDIDNKRREVCAKIKHYGSSELCDINDPCLYCKPILETAGVIIKPQSFLARLWAKTIFPDIIKRKKEEKALKTELRHEARMEALKDSKVELKEHYKKKELEKLKGGGGFTGILKKVGDDLAGSGFKLPSSDKIGGAFGGGKNNNNNNRGNPMGGGGNMFDSDKIKNMMGGSRSPNPKTPDHYNNNRFDGNRLAGLMKNTPIPPQVKKAKRKTAKKKSTKRRKRK